MDQAKPDRIVILSKAFGAQWEQVFFNDIQEAFDNGYRIADTKLREDACMRNFQGRKGRAVMYLEGKAPAPWVSARDKVEVPAEDKAATVIEQKELSTGVAENAPKSETPNKDKADKEAAEAKAAEKALAVKKAETAAKSKATKEANKLKKAAEETKDAEKAKKDSDAK